jgi:hypothetical protein
MNDVPFTHSGARLRKRVARAGGPHRLAGGWDEPRFRTAKS